MTTTPNYEMFAEPVADPKVRWKCTGCGRFVAAVTVSPAWVHHVDGSTERRGDCSACGYVEVW